MMEKDNKTNDMARLYDMCIMPNKDFVIAASDGLFRIHAAGCFFLCIIVNIVSTTHYIFP